MNKLKVLQIGLSYKIGGIETYLMNYLSNVNSEKICFEFVNVFDEAKNEFFYQELCKKVRVHDMPNYRNHPIKFFKALKKLQKDEKYDILHYNMNSACYLMPLIAAKLCGIKVIIAHSHNSSSDKGFFKKILHEINKHFIPIFANAYFACSDLAGSWFFSKKVRNSKDYYIINNAIDLTNFIYDVKIRKDKREELGISKDSLVIGHVGRFKKQKNHEFIVDIFNEYHKINNNSILLLVGNGPLYSNIEEKIEKMGLKESVILLGQRSDILELYQAMDIFLLPSLYEGLPLVGVEAQAVGLKCLFSDVITKEVKLSDNVKYLSLKSGSKTWAEEISKIDTNNRESVNADKFDIKQNSLRLEQIYYELKNIKGD